MFINASPAILLNKRLDNAPGCLLVLDVTQHGQERLCLTHFDQTIVGGHKEMVGVGHISIGRLNIYIVNVS